MNGRKLYREYAKYKRKDCCEFIKVKDDWDGLQEFEYKDSSGAIKKMNIHPADMVNWFIKSFCNDAWKSYKGERHG